MEIKRLKDDGIVKRNPDNSYVLLDSEQIGQFLQKRSKKRSKMSGTTESSKSQIQVKSHNISINNIDLSGYIEFMQKFNMLTSVGLDNAQNVGLRPGVAKKFAMRVCLKNPRKSSVFALDEGWQEELLYVFNNDPQILERVRDKNTKEKVALALEWDSIKDQPIFLGREFKDLKGMKVIGPGGYMEFCKSQFTDGEVCIHGDSKKDTENIVYELLEGTLDRSHTLKVIEENVARMPFVIVQIMGDQVVKLMKEGIQDAVKTGIKEGIEEANKYKPEKKEDTGYQ
jgi:hypothetical protein